MSIVIVGAPGTVRAGSARSAIPAVAARTCSDRLAERATMKSKKFSVPLVLRAALGGAQETVLAGETHVLPQEFPVNLDGNPSSSMASSRRPRNHRTARSYRPARWR